MTITTWVMVLTLAIGSATSSPTEDEATRPQGKIAGNCWINGVWYNPCPPEAPPDPAPTPMPENQLP